MIFESSLLGQVTVNEDEIITFPNALPGLEHCKRFKLFHDEDVLNPCVFWMQSLDDKEVLFNIVDASHLQVNYQLKLSDEQVKLLEAETPEDISIKVLIYKSGDEIINDPRDQIQHVRSVSKLQANLRAPLLINLEKRLGIQIFDLFCEIIFKSPGR